MSAPNDLDLVANPTLPALEAAVIARLMEQHTTATPTPGPLVTVEPYQGQLAHWIKDKGFHGPAVLVHFNGGDNVPKTTHGWTEEIELQLFLGVVNYRGSEEARVGVGSEIGAYGLVDLCYALFAGYNLGLPIKPLEPRGWHSIIAPEDRVDVPFALYRYDFALVFHRPRPLAQDVVDASTHLLTQTTLDLVDGPGPPDEGTADNVSQVTHPAP